MTSCRHGDDKLSSSSPMGKLPPRLPAVETWITKYVGLVQLVDAGECRRPAVKGARGWVTPLPSM